ncbi:MAG: TetR/AcrR family transcriptional regulator [Firmicutes bacterium]|nr:TetR/AcrR family transcriptional regulator [[Eubacterium] siraeum]MCM1487493.1 TetR/AcrR family transcriptional regulator [Bacillota bacterium]
MPKDKTASHLRIIAAMKAEFLEKGFENASVRSIAERANMSSAGLYRHYKDKEDMFDALIQPLIDQINDWLEKHKKRKYALAEKKADSGSLFGQSFTDLIKEVVYPNKEEFRLLLCCARGTKYENFIHDFVSAQQGELAEGIRYMKSRGYPAEEPLEEELHMLLSAYVSAMFEPVIHDYDEEKAMHCLDTIDKFFMPGWKHIMGL